MYDALELAGELHDMLLACVPVDPAFEPYLDEPAFRGFLRKYHLAEVESSLISQWRSRDAMSSLEWA